MTCSVCGAGPCINRSFCRLCRAADKRRTRSKYNDGRLNDARPTPQATVEAVMHAVRERGIAALKESATVERLERCDAAAMTEIEQRIASLREKSDAKEEKW
jgi:histidinol dehydrogenase